MRKYIRYLYNIFRRWILGRHPYNTIFNYNWVNVYPMIRTFRKLSNLFHGRIADLGSGNSPYYDLIAPTAKTYLAIDYLSALSKKEVRNIKRIAGVLQALPIANGSVDTVFCSQVLCQVLQPLDALQEIARILCPGGYAIISVPHVSPLHSEPYDLYRFTPNGLSQLVNIVGLRTCEIYIQGGLFASFALCFAMNLVLSPVIAGQSMKLLPNRQIIFAPLIALVNSIAYVLDKILPFSRTPVNFILVALKE